MYITTLVLSALSATLLIAPVAMHRFLFRIRVKDELVVLTNILAVAGLAILSLCMVGALILTSDWVAGPLAAWLCGGGAAVVLGSIWFAIPLWLRRRAVTDPHHADGEATRQVPHDLLKGG